MAVENVLFRKMLLLCMLNIFCSIISPILCMVESPLTRQGSFPNEDTELERLRQFQITHKLLLGQSINPANTADRKTFVQKIKDITAKRQEHNQKNSQPSPSTQDKRSK